MIPAALIFINRVSFDTVSIHKIWTNAHLFVCIVQFMFDSNRIPFSNIIHPKVHVHVPMTNFRFKMIFFSSINIAPCGHGLGNTVGVQPVCVMTHNTFTYNIRIVTDERFSSSSFALKYDAWTSYNILLYCPIYVLVVIVKHGKDCISALE